MLSCTPSLEWRRGRGRKDLVSVVLCVVICLTAYDAGGAVLFPGQTFPVEGTETGLAVADLDGDTIPDVAVTTPSDDSVNVLIGNGDGTFQEPAAAAAGEFPVGLVVADLDADGIPDLVMADRVLDVATVLIGKGTAVGFRRALRLQPEKLQRLASSSRCSLQRSDGNPAS